VGGSSGGGPTRIGNVQSLIEQAKAELKRKRNVFVSFSHRDLNEVNLLRGQAKNENSPLEFNDWSVSEPYNSERAEYIKQRISERILQSSVTVVYVTEESANSQWCAWEIQRSIELGKHVIGTYKGTEPPAVQFDALTQHGIECVPWRDLAEAIERLG
jgi:hypothetical protein